MFTIWHICVQSKFHQIHTFIEWWRVRDAAVTSDWTWWVQFFCFCFLFVGIPRKSKFVPIDCQRNHIESSFWSRQSLAQITSVGHLSQIRWWTAQSVEKHKNLFGQPKRLSQPLRAWNSVASDPCAAKRPPNPQIIISFSVFGIVLAARPSPIKQKPNSVSHRAMSTTTIVQQANVILPAVHSLILSHSMSTHAAQMLFTKTKA